MRPFAVEAQQLMREQVGYQRGRLHYDWLFRSKYERIYAYKVLMSLL